MAEIKLSPEGQALIEAASKNQTKEVLEFLKKKDIDPNCYDTNCFTPLNCASWFGCTETVAAMLQDPRVDPNQAGKIGEPPLFCAVQRRNLDVLKLLAWHPKVRVNQRKDDGATAFLFAAQEGYEAEMRVLLEVPGIDVNIGLNDGASPLFLACQNGHMQAVKLLLALGKRVQTGANWGGKTPAQHARFKKHGEIAKLLDSYEKNRDRIVWDLQREFGIRGELANPFNLFLLLLELANQSSYSYFFNDFFLFFFLFWFVLFFLPYLYPFPLLSCP